MPRNFPAWRAKKWSSSPVIFNKDNLIDLLSISSKSSFLLGCFYYLYFRMCFFYSGFFAIWILPYLIYSSSDSSLLSLFFSLPRFRLMESKSRIRSSIQDFFFFKIIKGLPDIEASSPLERISSSSKHVIPPFFLFCFSGSGSESATLSTFLFPDWSKYSSHATHKLFAVYTREKGRVVGRTGI